jgi:hypothetical protein
MKISIEICEKDETQLYRPVPIDQLLEMCKTFKDKIEIYVPNICGGETRITVYRSTCPNGNEKNLSRLKKLGKNIL